MEPSYLILVNLTCSSGPNISTYQIHTMDPYFQAPKGDELLTRFTARKQFLFYTLLVVHRIFKQLLKSELAFRIVDGKIDPMPEGVSEIKKIIIIT